MLREKYVPNDATTEELRLIDSNQKVDWSKRYHSDAAQTGFARASDPNALFTNYAGGLAKGFDARHSAHKTNSILAREAEHLRSDNGKLEEAINKGLSYQPMTDVEYRAVAMELDDRVIEGANGKLSDDQFKANEEILTRLWRALNNAQNAAGRALNQARFGIDMRTRDSLIYMREGVRAQFEKEFGDTVLTPEQHAQIEEQLKAREAEMAEMAKKLKSVLDDREAAIKNAVAEERRKNEDALKRAAEKAYAEGHAAAEREESERTVATVKRISEKYGDKVNAGATANAFKYFDAIYNEGAKRSAGNPEITLTQEMRDGFSYFINEAAKGDVDLARQILVDEGRTKELAFFDAYVGEVDAKSNKGTAGLAPKSAAKKKSENRKRIIEDDSKKGAQKVKDFTESKLDRLTEKAVNQAMDYRHSDNDADSMRSLGEYARTVFKRFIYQNGVDVKGAVAYVAEMMNNAAGEDLFTEDDARRAILCLDEFKPLTREGARLTLERAKKAKEILKNNPNAVVEAAHVAGIRAYSDYEIRMGMARRVGRMLDRRLNVLESRANEDNNDELAKAITNLIKFMKDIYAGKPIDEMLERYADAAIELRDFRRQRSPIEHLKSQIETLERRLATNDFEVPPRREKPDNDEQIKEIKRLGRKLEKLRESFKHARASWRVKKSPLIQAAYSSLVGCLGNVKAIAGSVDLSSVLRQGGQLSWAHPFLAAKNVKNVLAIIGDEEKANAAFDRIWDRPNAKYYDMAKIDFTDWGDNSVNPDDRFAFARFQNFIMKKMKTPIQMSERAFAMYLNLMRADVFDAMVANSPFHSAENMTREQLEALGNYINIASQRGSIDKNSNTGKALQFLNTVFWSPRNIASRLQFIVNTAGLLTPTGTAHPYGARDLATRKMLAKEIGRYAAGVGIAIFFAKMMADIFRGDDEPEEDLVFDPRSSDFLQVKIGNTHLDFLSGLKQMIVFGSRFTSGQKMNSRGKIMDINRAEAVGSFMRSKFAPGTSIVYDILSRETYDKEEIKLSPLVKTKDEIGWARYMFGQVSPLSIGDIVEQFSENGPGRTLVTGVLSILGLGATTYDSNTYRQLKGDYRYFRRLYLDARTDEERKEIERKYPVIRRMGTIEDYISKINAAERTLKKMREAGGSERTIGDYETYISSLKEQAMKHMVNLK